MLVEFILSTQAEPSLASLTASTSSREMLPPRAPRPRNPRPRNRGDSSGRRRTGSSAPNSRSASTGSRPHSSMANSTSIAPTQRPGDRSSGPGSRRGRPAPSPSRSSRSAIRSITSANTSRASATSPGASSASSRRRSADARTASASSSRVLPGGHLGGDVRQLPAQPRWALGSPTLPGALPTLAGTADRRRGARRAGARQPAEHDPGDSGDPDHRPECARWDASWAPAPVGRRDRLLEWNTF